MQSRRQFIERSSGAVAALGYTQAQLTGETKTSRKDHSRMRYRELGHTGMMVSEVVMGGNEITPNNYEHVFLALDMGLNYLDTSPAYGRGKSEAGFARVIKRRPRDSFYLTSKVSLWDDNRNRLFQAIFDSLSAPEQKRLTHLAAADIERRQAAHPDYLVNYFGSQKKELESAALSNVMEKEFRDKIDRGKNYKRLIMDSVEGSLSRLGTDYLDVIMCPHGASSPYELTDFPEILEAFEALKLAGKVRHLGVSAHTDPANVLEAAIKTGVYSVAMLAYNIVNHSFMDEKIAEAKSKGFGVIAMKVARPVFPGPNRGEGHAAGLASLKAQVKGDWTTPQKAYIWALRNPNLSGVISNMVNAEQVKANLPLPAMAESV